MHVQKSPTLVLLPGLDGTGLLFKPFIDALGSRAICVVVRYPAEAATVPEYAAAERIARDALPSCGPFVLLGESFSGPVALRIAASAPPGLVGVVLVASFASNPRIGLKWLRPLIRWLPTHTRPGWASQALLSDPYTAPAITSLLNSALLHVSPGAMRARLHAIGSMNPVNDISRIRVPILYLRGRSDRLIPSRAAEQIRAVARDVTIVDLPAPHTVLQCAPEPAAAAVLKFTDALSNQ